MLAAREHSPAAMRREADRLGLLPASNQQNDAADNADAARNRANRHRMLRLLVHLERPQLRHIFLGGEAGESAVSEKDDSGNDQNDADNARWLHETRAPGDPGSD